MSERLEQLLKLYKAEPSDPFLTYGVALEHAKSESFEEVVTWLDKTLELDKYYAYAYFQKGKALSQLGEEEDAISALKLGIEMAKESGDAHAVSELMELLGSMEED